MIDRSPMSMGMFQKKPRTAEDPADSIENIDPQIRVEAERRSKAETVVTVQSSYVAFTTIDGGGQPPMPIRGFADMWPSRRYL